MDDGLPAKESHIVRVHYRVSATQCRVPLWIQSAARLVVNLTVIRLA